MYPTNVNCLTIELKKTNTNVNCLTIELKKQKHFNEENFSCHHKVLLYAERTDLINGCRDVPITFIYEYFSSMLLQELE